MTLKNKIPITLYSYVTSPYAMKVHCYLLYKKLPFEIFYVSPTNPAKELPVGQQIPVLKIGGEVRNESSSLGIWLDNKFPDNAQLISKDKQLEKDILNLDQWVTDTLIPTVFYSVYPQINTSSLRCISNSLRLGYCVEKTTTNGLPYGLRFLWPIFIRNTPFIRRLIAPIAKSGSVEQSRRDALLYLEDRLKNKSFLAGTETPSLVDLSAWPQIVIPHKLGLKGFDDFMSYPNILRWVERIEPFLEPYTQAPPIVPKL